MADKSIFAFAVEGTCIKGKNPRGTFRIVVDAKDETEARREAFLSLKAGGYKYAQITGVERTRWVYQGSDE